jgi:hypothetical protein
MITLGRDRSVSANHFEAGDVDKTALGKFGLGVEDRDRELVAAG